MKIGIFTIAVSSVVLSGCFSTTIANPDKYIFVSMDNAAVLPTNAQLENRPYKVVVFDVNDKNLALAREAESGSTATRELVKQIRKSNTVIVSKTGLDGLKNAIDVQRTDYTAPAGVDYAVTGNITVAKYTKEYEKVRYTTDKNGKVHVTEPYCAHGTLLQGTIGIYDVKTMRLAHSFAISSGSHKSVKKTVNQSHSCQSLPRKEITTFLWSNGASAVGREDVQLMNFFRPKGYVLERRAKGDENIFKISIGKSNGVVADQDAVFYTADENKDPVTGAVTYVQNEIGEGTVSDKVHEKHSWVLIKDKELASKIKLGSVVKVVYEKSFMDKIMNHSFSN